MKLNPEGRENIKRFAASGMPAVPLTDPTPQVTANPAPTSKSRPSDDEIIDVLALHFRVHESDVVAWLLEIDLEAASQRIADSMAA